ncbi:MAG: NAD-dependent epimerase/dehydratase family protein [Actinomycetota bacterium]|nr:MAG: NAD-dependent epimerase/dehydratase family protein [Actinomycetota bacterium]
MVLLIGATSFLGPPILAVLLGDVRRVGCLLRAGSSRENLVKTAKDAGKEISIVSGDLLSPDSMIDPLGSATAAVYMVDLVNTALLENFLSAAQHTGLKRVVFISSTTVLIPLESKVKSGKLQSEDLIKKSNLDYTILRPSMIYGVADDPSFSRMLKFIKKRNFFVTFGSGKNLIQPVYIDDVADAVAKVLDNRTTFKKAYDLAGLEPLKYNEMLDIIRGKINTNFKIIRFPAGLSKALISIYARLSRNPSLTPGQIDRMGIDKAYSYQQAKDDFGFSPVSFEDGIEKLVLKLDLQ